MTQAEVVKQPVVSVENLHVRFVMRDADLYSFRFGHQKDQTEEAQNEHF